MIFVALLSEKLPDVWRKVFQKRLFVSRQSFTLTNHGGRGMGEPEKKNLTWRSLSITIGSVTVGISNVLQFSLCKTLLYFYQFATSSHRAQAFTNAGKI